MPAAEPTHIARSEPPTRTGPTAPVRARGLLLGIGAALVGLSAIFGYTTLRQRASFRAYKQRTLTVDPLPWDTAAMDVPACVEHTVGWGMACTGLESWCLNEAPRLTMRCLASSDRTAYCSAQGDAVASTRFGYAQCERLRSAVEGRYTQRAHKKFCAAAYRAVAEHCRGASQPVVPPVGPPSEPG